ncbi:hypothetical protein BDZ89DRAFT_1041697 [Hymenopellis radicata]|nr:hypothetical protein BDZ89DRAFT_1041697 [Hymenopellis radicata]
MAFPIPCMILRRTATCSSAVVVWRTWTIYYDYAYVRDGRHVQHTKLTGLSSAHQHSFVIKAAFAGRTLLELNARSCRVRIALLQALLVIFLSFCSALASHKLLLIGWVRFELEYFMPRFAESMKHALDAS